MGWVPLRMSRGKRQYRNSDRIVQCTCLCKIFILFVYIHFFFEFNKGSKR